MKRIACFALALCLTAGLFSGCGKKEEEKTAESSSPASSVTASTVSVSATPASVAKAVKVKADAGLNIRSQPSTDGEILGLAENGSMLPLLVGTPNNGWYEVEYQGKSAYVSAEYVEVQDVTLEEYNRLKEEGPSSETTSGTVDDDPARSGSSGETSSKASSGTSVSSGSTGGTEDGE